MNMNTEKLKQNFSVSFDGEEGMVSQDNYVHLSVGFGLVFCFLLYTSSLK